MSECGEHRLLLGAHALGGVEEPELGDLLAHLATCAACREEHRRLAQVVSLVDLAGLPDEPLLPEGFEDRLVARASRTEPRRRHRRRIWVPAAAGALAGAAVTAAALLLAGAFDSSAPRPPAALTTQLGATAQAPNASASVYVVNGKGWSTLALEARGLPRARAGERYVVWLSSDRGSYSVGTLEVTNGWASAVLHSPHVVAPGSLVEISLVRAGGHSYTPLVEGTLPS